MWSPVYSLSCLLYRFGEEDRVLYMLTGSFEFIDVTISIFNKMYQQFWICFYNLRFNRMCRLNHATYLNRDTVTVLKLSGKSWIYKLFDLTCIIMWMLIFFERAREDYKQLFNLRSYWVNIIHWFVKISYSTIPASSSRYKSSWSYQIYSCPGSRVSCSGIEKTSIYSEPIGR